MEEELQLLGCDLRLSTIIHLATIGRWQWITQGILISLPQRDTSYTRHLKRTKTKIVQLFAIDFRFRDDAVASYSPSSSVFVIMPWPVRQLHSTCALLHFLSHTPGAPGFGAQLPSGSPTSQSHSAART